MQRHPVPACPAQPVESSPGHAEAEVPHLYALQLQSAEHVPSTFLMVFQSAQVTQAVHSAKLWHLLPLHSPAEFCPACHYPGPIRQLGLQQLASGLLTTAVMVTREESCMPKWNLFAHQDASDAATVRQIVLSCPQSIRVHKESAPFESLL